MWFSIVITVLAAYLLGNLNGAVNISALIAHDDVRSHGSGNAGLTNFARNYGGWSTALVLLVDAGKTAIACLMGGLLLKPYGLEAEGRALGAVCVSLGHDFPALLGFRGGKGIICGVFAAAVMDWRIALIALGAFGIFYLISGYVSLGSVMGAVSFLIAFPIFWHRQPWVMAAGMLLGLLALFMHRANIQRLLKGQERKTALFQKGKKR